MTAHQSSVTLRIINISLWPYDHQSADEASEHSLKQKMNAVMQQSIMDPSPSTSTSNTASSTSKQLMAAIKAEMALFTSSGTREMFADSLLLPADHTSNICRGRTGFFCCWYI